MKIWPFNRKKQFDVNVGAFTPRPSERTLRGDGRKSYVLPTANSFMVRHAVKILKKHFGFQQTCPIACGGNEVVTHVRRGEITLYVCWDIWCGFDITARSEESDFIIADLAVYFDGIIQHPKFGKYFDVR